MNDSSRSASDAPCDAELAVRARDGDRESFAELYRRYAGTVHAILLAAAPRDEARDLVQAVFLLALRSMDRLAEPQRVGPWLCTIARNRAKDAHKSRAARTEWSDELEPAAAEPGDSGDADEARRLDGSR